ncbi:acyl-CoA N-acyltransferase [Ephemerocybe angulata]|uniref:Acyl-CoA N-acyltransferase n=1 Tax=Ephemerocybe angulata TaxID=980116 RepID=A0A8H6HYW8_9AGAR|nr:acyl-CoA N-acyltransferase [Tulosesus angulatus]
MSSLAVSVRRLTTITEQTAQSVKAVFEGAYKGDHFTDIMIGSDPTLFGDLHMMCITSGLNTGQVYVAENEEKDIVGVAVWYGPEQGHPLDFTDGAHPILEPFMPKLKPEVQKWWTDVFVPESGRLLGSQFAPDARLAAWYLQDLATAPAYQRQGVARALINEVKKQAAADGRAITAQLATNETKVEIFKKLGFSEIGERVEFTGPAPEEKGFYIRACVMEPTSAPKTLD